MNKYEVVLYNGTKIARNLLAEVRSFLLSTRYYTKFPWELALRNGGERVVEVQPLLL